MRKAILLALAVVAGLAATLVGAAAEAKDYNVQVGSRPYYLIDKMSDPLLQRQLMQCANDPVKVTKFSIGHRGAAWGYPEHSKESYRAAARMGAGIIECDVAFTGDAELVCRHSQCDLHTTTNILVTDLASKCSQPFAPAEFDANGNLVRPASARCCTSDLSLDEFKSLCGKMDASNPAARTPEEYLGGTPDWRTNLNATYPVPTNPNVNPGGVCTGTLMTHKESIELINRMGRDFTPELKTPSVPMPYSNPAYGIVDFTQAQYAQKMIDEYRAANISPTRVWPQSFLLDDVLYWVGHEPAFGRHAVYLEDAESVDQLPSKATLQSWRQQGVRVLGSPLFALVDVNQAGDIVPSIYARDARAAGLDIIGWTFERSPPVQWMKGNPSSAFYYQTVLNGLRKDGDIYKVLDVVGHDIGALGMFSDYPGTVSYYASCFGLE